MSKDDALTRVGKGGEDRGVSSVQIDRKAGDGQTG